MARTVINNGDSASTVRAALNTMTSDLYSGAALGVSPPSGGSSSAFFRLGTTSNFGIYFGFDPPTVSAAQGSIYLQTNGTSSTRMYVNTAGGTNWTTVTTAG